MEMRQDGVRVDCLPDGAHCTADKDKSSPLDIETCPCGFEICTGNCMCYEET